MSTIGRILKVTTFGESHGTGVGCIIEGIPPNLPITSAEIQYQLNRRKPNQNSLLSPRNEQDIVEIYSGIQENKTLGTPIALIIKNQDIKPSDYKSFSNIPRPGHADLTYLAKYGVKSASGGGRASARETVGRVAAGAAVEKFLKAAFGCEIVSFVGSIGEISVPKSFEAKIINEDCKRSFNGFVCLDKSFLDCVGTFFIFYLKKNQEKNTQQKKQEEETKEEDVEKWILVNKLVNKVFLFLIYKEKESELVDLGFEFLLDNQNNENKSNNYFFIYESGITNSDENKNKEKDYELLAHYSQEYYNKDLHKIILLLQNELKSKDNSVAEDPNALKFEDFLGENLNEELKPILLEAYKNIQTNKLKIKKNFFYNNEQFEYAEAINIRCPHVATSAKMIHLINKIKSEKDSIGGIASCIIRNVPRSLGEPCFDKFEAELAKAMLSIPATKGFEIGSGFEGTKLK